MERINFENNVTKASAETFNLLQDNIENAISNYSTTETKVGKWIDGKPIYRKCFSISNVATDQEYSTNTNISNIEKIISIMGNVILASNPDFNIPINFYNWVAQNGCYCFYNKTTNALQYRTSWNLSNMYITLEYTKTTD